MSDKNEPAFRKELEILINCHSMENGSNTPDFLLAEYLVMQLHLWDQFVMRREEWHGRLPSCAVNNVLLERERGQ